MPTHREIPKKYRDVPNVTWSDTEFDVCQFCGAKRPRPYIHLGRIGGVRRFLPFPCDCEQSRRFIEDRYVPKSTSKTPKALEGCDEETARQVADLMELGVGSYLWGGVGTGKTSTAYRAAALIGCRSHVATASEMKTAVLDSRGHQDEVYADLASCKVLVMDDLGNGEDPTSANVVMRVVNDRYERHKPVIVTSNYDLPDLGRRYGKLIGAVAAQSLVSRLNAMTERIKFDGADMRAEAWRR